MEIQSILLEATETDKPAFGKGPVCRLGMPNAVLGENAVLGCQLRDSTGKFRVHLRQVLAEDMQQFLPGRPGHAAVAKHLHRYLDTPLDYELVLHPTPEPPIHPRLGVNAYLGFHIGAPEAVKSSTNQIVGDVIKRCA
ncbi:MAG: type VI secretion system baseplate subunit TssG [Desulfovibrio sp.]|nr:type VI secretion system baseplate subunit TssG [Desulfovibrio sp.]